MPDRLYREHIIEHARFPRNKGVLEGATASHREVNARCGDVCVMQVKVASGQSPVVRFDGHGCALSTAAASMLTEKVIENGELNMTDDEFLQMLGVEVTSGRLDCALLPLRALRGVMNV